MKNVDHPSLRAVPSSLFRYPFLNNAFTQGTNPTYPAVLWKFDVVYRYEQFLNSPGQTFLKTLNGNRQPFLYSSETTPLLPRFLIYEGCSTFSEFYKLHRFNYLDRTKHLILYLEGLCKRLDNISIRSEVRFSDFRRSCFSTTVVECWNEKKILTVTFWFWFQRSCFWSYC